MEEYIKQTEAPHKYVLLPLSLIRTLIQQFLFLSRTAMRKAFAVGAAFSISQSIIYFAYGAIFYLGAYLVENDGLDFVDMFKLVD